MVATRPGWLLGSCCLQRLVAHDRKAVGPHCFDTMAETAEIELHDRVRVHSHEYSEHIKRAFVQLSEVWQDLETPADQQRKELDGTIQAALSTWTDTVARVKDQQQQVRGSIQQMLAQMMETKEALGAEDPAAEAELRRLQVSLQAQLPAVEHSSDCVAGYPLAGLAHVQ